MSADINLAHLSSIRNSASSFLSVPTGELVSDLRDPHGTDPDLGELVSVLVDADHDLIHNSSLAGSQKRGHVALQEAIAGTLQLVLVLREHYCLADDYVIARNTDACDKITSTHETRRR